MLTHALLLWYQAMPGWSRAKAHLNRIMVIVIMEYNTMSCITVSATSGHISSVSVLEFHMQSKSTNGTHHGRCKEEAEGRMYQTHKLSDTPSFSVFLIFSNTDEIYNWIRMHHPEWTREWVIYLSFVAPCTSVPHTISYNQALITSVFLLENSCFSKFSQT